MKYYRCDTCGLLLTDKMISKGICVGHKIKFAIRASIWEWFLIKIKLYEPLMLRKGFSE